MLVKQGSIAPLFGDHLFRNRAYGRFDLALRATANESKTRCASHHEGLEWPSSPGLPTSFVTNLA